jgi:uncharacterized protein YjaZ
METYKITGVKRNGKVGLLAYFKPVINYNFNTLDQESFVKTLASIIPNSRSIGYAGFSRKEYLKDTLCYNILDPDHNVTPQSIKTPLTEILPALQKALDLCYHHISASPVHIFLFPTFSSFVKETMNGVSGYTPYKNTLLLFISPQKTKEWKQALIETICHEFMHAVMNNYSERETLLDDLIFEGIAESFVTSLLGKQPHLPSQSLIKEDALQWHQKLKKHLSRNDLYYPVFLEGKDYPLWAGYAVGYYIVEAFREKHPEVTWDEIVRLNPREIYLKAKL